MGWSGRAARCQACLCSTFQVSQGCRKRENSIYIAAVAAVFGAGVTGLAALIAFSVRLALKPMFDDLHKRFDQIDKWFDRLEKRSTGSPRLFTPSANGNPASTESAEPRCPWRLRV